ncbi:MAG: OmpH family outer membrane protein [Roseivirga sp.]|nr:OmpH family outer membrane protein [Roseivirga sp.]
MKKRLLLSIIVMSCIYCANVNGQSQKVGYLAVDRVLILMPEMDAIRSELQDFQGKINSQIQVKYETIQNKVKDYETLVGGLDQEAILARERELESLDRDLQKYRLDAQQASAQKENKLMEPVYKRIQEAIDAVAKDEGFGRVFRAETMLYIGNAVDIFESVLKKLEIDLPKEEN